MFSNFLAIPSMRQTRFSILENICSLFQFLRPLPFVGITRGDRPGEQFRNLFDPERQQFYGMFIHLRSLELP